MTNIGQDKINLPTDTGEWGSPQFWGAGEHDWGLIGWSGYSAPLQAFHQKGGPQLGLALGSPYRSIITFDVAMSSEWTGAEYLRQIVELFPLQKILRADSQGSFCVCAQCNVVSHWLDTNIKWSLDLVLGDDATRPQDHNTVIALQAMQIRWCWAYVSLAWSMVLLACALWSLLPWG